jgi:hypothetical protein
MTIAHVTNSLDLGAQLNDLLNTIIDAVNAGTSGVITFNTRNGAVTLTEADVSAAQGSVGAPQTASGGAATLNGYAGAVTSEALVAATTYTLTLTNSKITANSIVLVQVIESTGAANPIVHSVTPGAGSVAIVVSMASLTGTLLFNFIVAN